MDLRLLLLSSHYRSRLNFTWKALKQAQKNLQKITDFVYKINKNNYLSDEPSALKIPDFQKRIEKAMDDDLNTPLALSILYEFISHFNKLYADKKISTQNMEEIKNFWEKINKIFGLQIPRKKSSSTIPEKIIELAKKRELARRNGNFELADSLREQIKKFGYKIIDHNNNAPEIIPIKQNKNS
ncbi:MAG TPA: hypothetical protein ENJ49_01510 [Candidatus Moranbacteria bacterium]|nr:hypothetical protein [Candidatus Moranbacteria bacterium]